MKLEIAYSHKVHEVEEWSGSKYLCPNCGNKDVWHSSGPEYEKSPAWLCNDCGFWFVAHGVLDTEKAKRRLDALRESAWDYFRKDAQTVNP